MFWDNRVRVKLWLPGVSLHLLHIASTRHLWPWRTQTPCYPPSYPMVYVSESPPTRVRVRIITNGLPLANSRTTDCESAPSLNQSMVTSSWSFTKLYSTMLAMRWRNQWVARAAKTTSNPMLRKLYSLAKTWFDVTNLSFVIKLH